MRKIAVIAARVLRIVCLHETDQPKLRQSLQDPLIIRKEERGHRLEQIALCSACACNQLLCLRERRGKGLFQNDVPACRNRLPCIVKMCAVDNAEVDKVRLMRREHRPVVCRHLRDAELLRQRPCLVPALRTCTDRNNLDSLHLTQSRKCLPCNHPRTNNCYLHF